MKQKKTPKAPPQPIVLNNRPPSLPSLRSLMSDEVFNALSPAGQQRVLNNQAMEGWSDDGDAWLHSDVLSADE